MPHPNTNPLVGLPFYDLLQVSGSDPIVDEVRCTQPPECPHCQNPASGLKLKAWVQRKIRHVRTPPLRKSPHPIASNYWVILIVVGAARVQTNLPHPRWG